ncbi:MAG: septal ring lytic transglycosylase RlpA family protein [Candidatus Omnitrophota bacterium]
MKNIVIALAGALLLLAAHLTGAKATSIFEGSFMAGSASWYSQRDPGVLATTANMEIFNDQDLTCAIWDVPFNTLIKVTNRKNGRSITVRVNDRGPAKRLVDRGRIIDLSKKAFASIADLREGIIDVEAVIMPGR